MVRYKVVITPEAVENIEAIFDENSDKWSLIDTLKYTQEIKDRIENLSEFPHRFSFDEYTRIPKMFRSFEHKSHKVFFVIYEDTKTVDILAVLPSRSKYSAKL